MSHTWEAALSEYSYGADLARFDGAHAYPGWFDRTIAGRHQTGMFEARFREHAHQHIEAWGEVVFWKLYTTRPSTAKQERTHHVLHANVSPGELWSACIRYTETPGLESFRSFRSKLFRSSVVATAATFPAFICPAKFPMVDRQVTLWARNNSDRYRYSDIGGPNLVSIPVLGDGVLRESHWAFVESWIAWCRFTARILSRRTGSDWCARDVEMAVFTAQRSQLPLNPLK